MNNNKDREHDSLSDLGFEREDLSARAIIAFLIGLAVFVIIVHFAVTGLMRFADEYTHAHQKPKSPLVALTPDTRAVTPAEIAKVPQPRLETDEATEIFGFREEEEERLNTYGWVDQKAGIVHIPIERAMQLIAQRGLPTTPQTGEIPPSTVNMVKAAAARADHSGGSTGLETTGPAKK
jgi:hypothetical protein